MQARKPAVLQAIQARAFSEKGVNDKAPHSIMIQYCGGWGYRSKVNNSISQIDKTHPDTFSFHT